MHFIQSPIPTSSGSKNHLARTFSSIMSINEMAARWLKVEHSNAIFISLQYVNITYPVYIYSLTPKACIFTTDENYNTAFYKSLSAHTTKRS